MKTNSWPLLLSIMIFMNFILIGELYSNEDVTTQYYNLVNSDSIISDENLDKLRESKVFFVPGILSEVVLEDIEDKPPLSFAFVLEDYFESQLNYFNGKLGIEAERIIVTTKSPKRNREIIIEAIKSYNGDKKLVMVCHSMGGLSTLDALIYLLRNDPKQLSKVSAVLTMQSPFYGAIIADLAISSERVQSIVNGILARFGGKIETFRYLGTSIRKIIMDSYKYDVYELERLVPILTMGSYITRSTHLFPLRNIISNGTVATTFTSFSPLLYNGPYEFNDGMVELSSSEIPLIPSVVIKEVDHIMPILHLPFARRIKKNDMTLRLLNILLDL